MIVVAQSAVARAASLSERAQLVLGFIRNGRAWLDWIINAPSVRHDFADEGAMLDAIQIGLHATPFLRLARLGLLVSPVKLMTVHPPDLSALAAVERGDGNPAVLEHARNVLAAHRLVTDSDFARADHFLQRLGLDQIPVLRTMTLAERLAIFELARLAQGADAKHASVHEEAAIFAAAQADTPLEIADCYKLYVALAAKPGNADAAPERRAALAARAVEVLLPSLYGALDCPALGKLAGPAEISRTMRTWIGRGRQVGFARLSSGARQIVENTSFEQLTPESAKQLVPAYLREAQSFLSTTEIKRGMLGQDGVTCVLTLESETRRAEVEVGAGGQITLRAFHLKAPTRPAASGHAGIQQQSLRP